jgi:hypothetical protein
LQIETEASVTRTYDVHGDAKSIANVDAEIVRMAKSLLKSTRSKEILIKSGVSGMLSNDSGFVSKTWRAECDQ